MATTKSNYPKGEELVREGGLRGVQATIEELERANELLTLKAREIEELKALEASRRSRLDEVKAELNRETGKRIAAELKIDQLTAALLKAQSQVGALKEVAWGLLPASGIPANVRESATATLISIDNDNAAK